MIGRRWRIFRHRTVQEFEAQSARRVDDGSAPNAVLVGMADALRLRRANYASGFSLSTIRPSIYTSRRRPA